MNKKISCEQDSRTLLDFIQQDVIGNGIKNLVVDYFFFHDIDDPDAPSYEPFSFNGLAVNYESIMQPHSFEFKFFMNQEVQFVAFDFDLSWCYIEIWV